MSTKKKNNINKRYYSFLLVVFPVLMFSACGIGTNLYLAKIALDIMAKHTEDHIAVLNEAAYPAKLWNHKPLTDFWRIGPGIAKC